jgi:endonuclease/exonuclease/phosphatase family metal-dependent hydrolase
MASLEVDRLGTPPTSELLVLTANLQQGHGDPSTNQMEIFADRVVRLLPFAPDVLLLQEVNGASAKRVARLLRHRTPYDYRVLIGPAGDVVQSSDEEEEVVWDSAIVLNTDTTQSAGNGGVITSRFDPADGVPGQLARTKQHSYLPVKKSDWLLPIALVSIHFVQSLRLLPRTRGFCYKDHWIKEIVAFLSNHFPPTHHVHVIGGDLNNARCLGVPETIKCDEWPFWNTATSRSGFSDAIFSVHGSSNRALHRQARRGNRIAKPRIDYIFARTPVINSSHDVTYGARPGEPGFYSDHRFLWAQMKLPPVVAKEESLPETGNG